MKTKLGFAIILTLGTCVLQLDSRAQEPTVVASPADSVTPDASVAASMPEFKKLADAKWERILPELGESSPEMCILHIDPTTHATSMLIRTPKAIHIRKHWHTANESHVLITGTAKFECDGKKIDLGPGSFNFMPAKMVHEAWLPAGSLTFISVDGAWDVNWTEGPPTSADLSRTY